MKKITKKYKSVQEMAKRKEKILANGWVIEHETQEQVRHGCLTLLFFGFFVVFNYSLYGIYKL